MGLTEPSEFCINVRQFLVWYTSPTHGRLNPMRAETRPSNSKSESQVQHDRRASVIMQGLHHRGPITSLVLGVGCRICRCLPGQPDGHGFEGFEMAFRLHLSPGPSALCAAGQPAGGWKLKL